MVEETIPTWETFCEHHDVATLSADQAHIRRYEDVVKLYAGFAGNAPTPMRGQVSAPVVIRWKTAGVMAIKSITSSDTVGADGGRQLNIILPVLLQNIYSENPDFLAILQQSAEANEKTENDSATRRRTSFATVRTVDTTPETNPAAVSGTIADADRLAEEQMGIAALESLKQLFVANNRAQIRIATTAILRFINTKAAAQRPNSAESARLVSTSTWATTLMEMITRWCPVQDRFVILVTTMETLVRSPVTEDNLLQQLLLVTIVSFLLSSSINMIGLSVMDVLLGLIQHILLLLQLGGKGSNVLPHHQQTDAIDLFKPSSKEIIDQPSPTDTKDQDSLKLSNTPSATRQELLTRLRRCIGALATHIYYSDQISDMITAILLRLKPSPMSGITNSAVAIEYPAAAAAAISDSVNLREDPNTDEFFSFGTARVTALNAIKDVLTVANKKHSLSGAAVVGRNRVSVQTWDGTQWLLRDEDRRVRRAYVDALLTWLHLEMSKNDLRVMEDKRHLAKGKINTNGETDRTSSLTQRAISSASQRSKITKPSKSTFLQLLHLAIYNNALECPASESDILLLHLLMFNLVEKLGVNAVKSGLPMILRLQEDINIDQLVTTPTAKINIGSLVHGYLLALSEKFELETTLIGHGIINEVTRRRNHGLWLDGVRTRPLTFEQVVSGTYGSVTAHKPMEVIQTESLRPFDAVVPLVDQIANSYSSSLATPPASPPTSPGRVFSLPISSSAGPASSIDHELPMAFREAMLSTWTKESCIATVEKDSAPTASLNGSRSGTNRSGRNGFLIANDNTPRDGSPTGAMSTPQLQLSKQRNAKDTDYRPNRADPRSLAPLQQDQPRRSSAADTGPPTPISSSDQHITLRVDDLKRVLAGGALAEAFSHRNNGSMVRAHSPLRTSSTAYQDFAEKRIAQRGGDGVQDNHDSAMSSDSNSVVDAEGFDSASEGDLPYSLPAPNPAPTNTTSTALANEYTAQLGVRPFEHSPSPGRTRPTSKEYAKSRPRSSSSASGEDPEANARALKGELVRPMSRGSSGVDGEEDDEVPPVPPLPPNFSPMSPTFSEQSQGARISEVNAAARFSNGSITRSMAAPATLKNGPIKESSISDMSSVGRSSLRRSGSPTADKKASIQQLLSGIEVGDGGIGKGVGRPPY